MMTARDEIVDALGIKNFVFRAPGLKAPNTIAQGNALGLVAQFISSPERAGQKSRVHFVVPLQGTLFFGFVSQGVALGCHVIALSARDETGLKARNKKAQGIGVRIIHSPERARQKSRDRFVAPLQSTSEPEFIL